MLKKFSAILCIAALLSMLCTAHAFAEASYTPAIAISKANPNAISVSGAAPDDAGVTLTVLNPGKTLADLDYSAGTLDAAIAYTDAAIATGGRYEFEAVLLRDRTDDQAIGGEFTIVVNIAGVTPAITLQFEFYYSAAKLNVIKKFNETPESDILEKCIQVYSLKDDPRWKNGKPQLALAALNNIKASLAGQKFTEAGENAPLLFTGYLQQALLTAALNSGRAELVSSDAGIDPQILNYFDEGAVKDYNTAITNTGRKNVLTSLLTGQYRLMENAAESFTRSVAFNVIASNVKQGYGHVDGYLETYRNIYQDAGFELGEYDGLSKNEKNKFLSVFTKESFSDLGEMKNKFNATLKTYDKPSGGSGSKGSGGGTGSGKAISNTKGEEGLIIPETIPTCPFGDMDAAPWAKEAVSVLYGKNIISGYNEKEYNPNGNVTRAEFTKLIMELGRAAGAEQKKDGNKPIRVAAIGDSLTQGLIGDDGKYTTGASYSEYLAKTLGEGYEVKNFGLSSYGLYEQHQYSYRDTEEYRAALAYHPDIVIILFGTNDAKTMYWDTIKAQYEEIYQKFVQEFVNLKSNPQVIVALPTPVFGESNFAKDRPQSNMAEVREIITGLANNKGWKLVDSYGLFANSEALFPDGLHYNKQGAQTIANAFADAIKGSAMGEDTISFDDVASGDWYADYVEKAAASGIVRGSGSLFYPNDTITRQDAAVILYRLLSESVTFMESASFSDDEQISGYAREAVAGLAGAKIINGMSDGSFQPKGLLTRAQAAALIYSAYRTLKQ